ncbi:hypothetical protein P170DRAFT_437550 [Aspergillus steynii IBT 23096]|uniref:Required for respiratory growth protein 9, mitochondrial n=1 Tax=Aspergillus steynii IBT 23096 TaxID=1392250 RepID=A0A2I2G4L0_9EURO|nr:uncharacterized protein P170DRAFT_437550 [Aspergillus steynii IBT 23096]PLB47811.1 hypothetical protein P170DRAFT_437550 [Aspergillus steynii IBT 23096]
MTAGIMFLSTILRNVTRSELAGERYALCDCRNYLTRYRAFPNHRYQNATQFSTLSGHRTPDVEADLSSQHIVNSTTEKHRPSHSNKKAQDRARKPKPKTNTAESSNSVDPKTSKSSRTKKRSDVGQTHSQPKPKKKREHWQIQKSALQDKFKDGWNPVKKLSPDALDGIRHLHSIAPEKFTTPVLAEQFEVSPEAIRRILKSKWRATEAELESRRQRWEKRHDRIWSHLTQLGLRPKTKRTAPYDDVGILYDKSGSGDR